MESERMKYSAVENLSINRYLDLSPEFYSVLFSYYSFVLTMNEFLADWRNNPQYYEERILSYKEGIEDLTKQMQAYLAKPL